MIPIQELCLHSFYELGLLDVSGLNEVDLGKPAAVVSGHRIQV